MVTVDGLDVIDGETGDLRKRGYIVPAYGEVRIEGFRTSLADVATFRFSSVDGSYAGQKGKARNVGVIAVAIFEEQAPPPEQQIIVDAEPPPRYDAYDYRDDLDASARRPRGPTSRRARAADVAKATSTPAKKAATRAGRRADARRADAGRAGGARRRAAPRRRRRAAADDEQLRR